MSQAAYWQIFMFSVFLLPFILGGIHAAIIKKKTKYRITHILLCYCTFIYIGFEATFFGLNQIFQGEAVAQFIGWKWSPFVREVGMANLSYGILGLLSFWRRDAFRVATVLGSSMFLLFAYIGHLYDIITTGNFNPGNAGVILYTDIFIPIIFAVLLIMNYRAKKKQII